MYDLLIIGSLLFLVGLSFYAGYQFALPRVVEAVLTSMNEEQIIRMIEGDDGDIEIYSGYKFYKGDVK